MFFIKGIGNVPSKEDRVSYAERTPYFKKGKFSNIHEYPLMVKSDSKKAKDLVPKEYVPVVKQKRILRGKAGDLNLYWLGHSSSLVQLGDKNILIDPVLTKYSSPFDFVGVKIATPMIGERLEFEKIENYQKQWW